MRKTVRHRKVREMNGTGEVAPMKFRRPEWVPEFDLVFVGIAILVGTLFLLVTSILWIH